jgi:hypothetical protein
LDLLAAIEKECEGVRIQEFTPELRRCCSALNGGATSSSLRLTAVLLPDSLPLLVLHGLPQGSAEGTVYCDGSKGAAVKALPPQLLQSRYRQPELDIANLLRALRGLPCVSLRDLPDQQRALDPASILGTALSSRGGAFLVSIYTRVYLNIPADAHADVVYLGVVWCASASPSIHPSILHDDDDDDDDVGV